VPGVEVHPVAGVRREGVQGRLAGDREGAGHHVADVDGGGYRRRYRVQREVVPAGAGQAVNGADHDRVGTADRHAKRIDAVLGRSLEDGAVRGQDGEADARAGVVGAAPGGVEEELVAGVGLEGVLVDLPGDGDGAVDRNVGG